MRLKITRIFLLILTIFIGVGALFGGVCMIIRPDGSLVFLDGMLDYFQVLPFAELLFQDYIFSGVMLIIINGISNIIATILIIRNRRIGYILGTIFGITLMMWITIQFIIFPFFVIDLVYFILGCLQFVCGYIAFVSYNQEYFHFDETEYFNINKESTTLVVYFSRKQYTKKIAYQKANQLGAAILEITTPERTAGDIGFWWCGRFALHRWPMEIDQKNINLSQYTKIIIVSPIWIFKMCSPIRGFIMNYQKDLNKKEVNIIFNHFNPWLSKSSIKEVKQYINVSKVESVSTWLGHTFY